MSSISLQHILAAEPGAPAPSPDDQHDFDPPHPAPMPSGTANQPYENQTDGPAVDVSAMDFAFKDELASPTDPVSNLLSIKRATTTTSANLSSVYSGNKIKHLKKEDGHPLWRRDIQYEFLRLVFSDPTEAFTRPGDATKRYTFADVYIDAMAKSSKCSKILKEKLLQDTEGAICMAMVCLLVNLGRMNTTLNFFPEMRAQLRTYHSIPALQAHQDPKAYKQLQDAPRLKSILKGATEDEPQPSTMEEIKAAKSPRTNPVNLIFVMSQYAPKISEMHFQPPRDFFDLIMRPSLSSASRARAFLWLIWWYLESDFSYEDSQRNPFGAGQYAEGEEGTGVLPLKVPNLESLTEEQAALENIDTEEEKHYGEVKRKERISILASEPSPAMTALKRARNEKMLEGSGYYSNQHQFNDEGGSESGRVQDVLPPASKMHEAGSDYTRSPSPGPSASFQAVNVPGKAQGDMRINHMLNNDDTAIDASPSQVNAASVAKKGPGRGNWRRNKTKDVTLPLAVRGIEMPHHIPLLPNTGQLNFVNEAPHAPIQPATPSSRYGQYGNNVAHLSPDQATIISYPAPSGRDHIPTPSYQAQKRNRGVTQHQSAVITYRRQRIEYTLDKLIRRIHKKARTSRLTQGSVLRAWQRIRQMPPDYDSEEEQIKTRKARERLDKDDDWRHKGKENVDSLETLEDLRRPRVLMAGFARAHGEPTDVGEEASSLAKTLQRAGVKLEKWSETKPGDAMIRRQRLLEQGQSRPRRRKDRKGVEHANDEGRAARRVVQRQRSSTGRVSEYGGASQGVEHRQGPDVEPDDEDGGAELDQEDRDILGEVDADETENDEDDEMDDI